MELPSLIKQILRKILGEKSLFGSVLTCFLTLPFSIVFIFSSFTYYTYCSTLISTIIQHVQIILLYTLIVITIVIIFVITIILLLLLLLLLFILLWFLLSLFLLLLLFSLFYLLLSFKIYLYILFLFIFIIFYLIIYLLIDHGPIRPEETPFDRFSNPGVLRVEGVS